MSGYDSVNRNILSRVRKVARDGSTPEGQQPKMLGCQQWNGEPEAGRGSRCRKSEILGDLEGRQRQWTDQGTTDRRCTGLEFNADTVAVEHSIETTIRLRKFELRRQLWRKWKMMVMTMMMMCPGPVANPEIRAGRKAATMYQPLLSFIANARVMNYRHTRFTRDKATYW